VSRYGQILRTPGVPLLFFATTLARLPFGINGIAVLLFLREVTGSFGIAGLGAGALALGAGLGAPFAARLVDRRGVGFLIPLAIGHAGGLAALFALGEAGAPAAALVATAAIIGTSFPPSGAVLRSRWSELLGGDPELVRSAYAFDSVVVEVSFVSGPLITAGVVALAGPQFALAISAALVVAGTTMFVAALPRSSADDGSPGFGGILGALAVPAVRVVALTTLPVGFCLGAIEVALPAFSHAEGRQELGGVFLALWSGGSAVGGFVFGARRLVAPITTTYLWMAAILPLACLPLAAASSPFAVGALAILAGLPIAPLIASRNELLAATTPRDTGAEAFTWLMTALVAGLSIGAAVAGALVELDGWPVAVLTGVAVAMVGAVLSFAARGALAPAPAVG
jgi:MFS family permease